MVSGTSTLFIKHLPPELSAKDREEMLKLVGAVAVRVMPDNSKMKFTAFASFQNHEDAKYALSILHQKEVLGKTLVVEYAKEQHQKFVPLISDNPKQLHLPVKESSSRPTEKDALKLGMEDFARKIHGIAPALGLDYLPSPLLKYKYPPPTSTVIQNISHALVSVPKFYTQVLHLMNKMNLPAPFGPLTPAPPLPDEPILKSDDSSLVVSKIDDVNPVDIDQSSEEESEYESEEGEEKIITDKVLPAKRPLSKPKIKRKRKAFKLLPSTSQPKQKTEPSDVFESQPIMQKKISVKKIDHINPLDTVTTTDIEPIGGFGEFKTVKEIESQDDGKESELEIWKDSHFITAEELKEKRISSREMKTLSIFRNYSPGEPTFRLYIKNLAKQVDEKDLRYIFGRYIDRNSETDRNMFDIRVMKEGRMKGQAFVTLANEKQAIKAVNETNGFILHTKPIVVQFARSAKPKEDTKKLQKP